MRGAGRKEGRKAGQSEGSLAEGLVGCGFPGFFFF